jgi:hypothetical protein
VVLELFLMRHLEDREVTLEDRALLTLEGAEEEVLHLMVLVVPAAKA